MVNCDYWKWIKKTWKTHISNIIIPILSEQSIFHKLYNKVSDVSILSSTVFYTGLGTPLWNPCPSWSRYFVISPRRYWEADLLSGHALCNTWSPRQLRYICLSRTPARSTTAPLALVDKMRKNGFTKDTRRTVVLGYECPDLGRRPCFQLIFFSHFTT